MKHTDFHKLHKQLDEKAREELTAAVKAHGNEYTFIHYDDEGNEWDWEDKMKAPVIMASTTHMESDEDFYVTRVTIENGCLVVYGFSKDGWDDEYELDHIAHGHLEYIIDQIPETEEVKDVTIP